MKKIRLIISICLIAVLATTASCSGSRVRAENGKGKNTPKIRLVNPVYTELKADKTIYDGNALSAEYYDNEHLGIIMSPEIKGILSNGNGFSVSSDRAYYHDNNRLITLTDNIHASIGDEYQMTTTTLDYMIEKKLIVASEPVTVTGRDLQLHANKGSIDLEDNVLTMQGDINAKIYNMSLK